jgi:hypothetical protein
VSLHCHVWFPSLHFGPRAGVDAIYDGLWGLPLADFNWGAGVPSSNFSWNRTQTNGWRMEQWVNAMQVWAQETAYVDRFFDLEKGKRFHGARPEEFAECAAGDPMRVFQRACSRLTLRLHTRAHPSRSTGADQAPT